jgi:hypothetical protein
MFNRHLSSGRVIIEQAFGQLKSRWRILKFIGMEVDFSKEIIFSCFVLHNICKFHDDDFYSVEVEASFVVEVGGGDSDKRDQLCDIVWGKLNKQQ